VIARTSLVLFAMALSACTTSRPANVDNICSVFQEKRGWYAAAQKAEQKWGSPVPVTMAIIHQESRFVARAKPPRKQILGFIPGGRPSNAYGYTQALTGTWSEYQRSAGNYRASRSNFTDAVDFVGWYNQRSYQRNGIAADDVYNLYLAYHEGHGGFNRRTYASKGWLLDVAGKVRVQSDRYQSQLDGCRSALTTRRFGIF